MEEQKKSQKFQVDEEVFLIEDGIVVNRKITVVQWIQKKGMYYGFDTNITRAYQSVYATISEDILFKTKEDLIKSL